RNLAFLGLTIVALAGIHGCKKKPAPTTQHYPAPAGAESPHEKLMKDSIAFTNDLAAMLETVQDNASATSTIPKLRQMGARAKEIQDRIFSMPDPAPQEEERLEKLYDAQMKAAEQRLVAAHRQASQRGGPEFVQALQEAMLGKRP